MVMMCLLSWEICPNPLTTDLVGKRCVTPQARVKKAPKYRRIWFIKDLPASGWSGVGGWLSHQASAAYGAATY